MRSRSDDDAPHSAEAVEAIRTVARQWSTAEVIEAFGAVECGPTGEPPRYGRRARNAAEGRLVDALMVFAGLTMREAARTVQLEEHIALNRRKRWCYQVDPAIRDQYRKRIEAALAKGGRR